MGLSTHVLDTALGRPAANVDIRLFRWHENAAGGAWEQIGAARTDAAGRCGRLLVDQPLQTLDYKLQFKTAAYFRDLKIESLYPDVEITFSVRNPEEHYHIPLLIAANGYTTYRGS